jgi:D-serine deaminase-like pyridoxal phosphate-dependent protein
VLARVASVQRAGRAITDAGLKAMSSDTIAAAGSVGIACDLSGAPLPEVTFADANEEHGFLLGDGAGRLRVGDLVRLVPNHACGTNNMWSHIYAVRADEVLDDWPISARY